MSEEKRNVADVFLRLVQKQADCFDFPTFRALVETWIKVRDLEAIADVILPATEEAPGGAFHSPTVTAEEAPEPEEDEEARKQKQEQRSETMKNVFARRKQTALSAVAMARSNDVSLQTLADKSGLTLNVLMDLINGVPRPIGDWASLERGLQKLGYLEGKRKKKGENDDERQDGL